MASYGGVEINSFEKEKGGHARRQPRQNSAIHLYTISILSKLLSYYFI